MTISLRIPPVPAAFGGLYGLESLTRALTASLAPLTAYAVLGSARDVSLLFAAASVATMVLTLNLPRLVSAIGRHWLYRIAAVCFGLAPALILSGSVTGLAAGVTARAVATAIAALCLNLYIQQFVLPRDWVRAEPLRLFFGGISWSIGPTLGVWLNQSGRYDTQLAALCVAAVILLVFQSMRLNAAAEAIQPPLVSRGAVGNLGHFFRQPGLRQAFLLGVAKTVWWSVLYTYAPIMMVEGGESAIAASIPISAANTGLFIAPLYGHLANRFGLRRVVLPALLVTAGLTAAAAATTAAPWVAAAILVGAAISNTAIDCLCAVVLMRSVKPDERTAMATVFTTHREVSELAAPTIMAALLLVAPLPIVFVGAAIWLAATAWACRDLAV